MLFDVGMQACSIRSAIERMAEAERLVVEAASRMPEGSARLGKIREASEEVPNSVLDMARQALTQLQSSQAGKPGLASDLKPDINSGTAASAGSQA